MNKKVIRKDLYKLYPSSPPCNCEICRSYCLRPGWWTIDEAKAAISAGYARKMMLEISIDRTFGVLSPAFKGCESNFALQEYSKNGCTFFSNGLCELHKTIYMPLECRFCHHSRKGLGQICHHDIELQWNSLEGKKLVEYWGMIVRLWEKYHL